MMANMPKKVVNKIALNLLLPACLTAKPHQNLIRKSLPKHRANWFAGLCDDVCAIRICIFGCG